jgi:uncharacterized membrane protein YqjE
MATTQSQRTVPEVLNDIVGNLQAIVRAEFRLAKTELKEEADKASRPAAVFGGGLAAGFYAMGLLLLSLVYGLSTIMAGWLAALLVGMALAVTAVALITSSGKKLKQLRGTPDKTIQSLEEDFQWAKHQNR